MTLAEIKELFRSTGVSLSPNDLWEVQKTPVVKHSALERLGAALKVMWDVPTIIRSERDECVVLVRGHRNDVEASEWSFGEACIGLNYRVSGNQSGYPYAMAEKRGKDRVLIKLAGLHGAYSDEEAEGLKAANADTKPAEAPKVSAPSQMDQATILQLIAVGDEAAERGVQVLEGFWKARTAEERKLMGADRIKAWKASAERNDALAQDA